MPDLPHDHVPRRAALRVHRDEAAAARVLADNAYECLLPRVRAGETRLTRRALAWAWQGSVLLGLESGIVEGHDPFVLEDELDDEARYDSPPLPVWQWKLVWLLVGYGLHLLLSEVDFGLMRAFESFERQIEWAEEDGEDDGFSEEDRAYVREHASLYRHLVATRDHGRRLWHRIEVLVHDVVHEVSEDALAMQAWVLDPIPMEA